MIVKMVGAIFIALGSKPAAEAWYDLEFSRETEPVGNSVYVYIYLSSLRDRDELMSQS